MEHFTFGYLSYEWGNEYTMFNVDSFLGKCHESKPGSGKAVYFPRERQSRKKRDKIEIVDVDKIWLGLTGGRLMIQ